MSNINFGKTLGHWQSVTISDNGRTLILGIRPGADILSLIQGICIKIWRGKTNVLNKGIHMLLSDGNIPTSTAIVRAQELSPESNMWHLEIPLPIAANKKNTVELYYRSTGGQPVSKTKLTE